MTTCQSCGTTILMSQPSRNLARPVTPSFEQPGVVPLPKPSVRREVSINLEDIEEETRCAVCLGVIKDARLIAQCMHRFCAVCIEKWLRQSKQNDCPQCRKPMQSRRDCKSDPRFDRLVALLFNDLEEYEKQQVDDEALEKAFQLGAELSRQQEHRKLAMPRPKRGPLPRSRAGSGSFAWAGDVQSPTAAAAAAAAAVMGGRAGKVQEGEETEGRSRLSQGSTGSAAHKRQKLGSGALQLGHSYSSPATQKVNHRKGSSRRSRHGRQEALHVSLEDDDYDVAGLAQQLMQQAQRGFSSAAMVAFQLLPDPKTEGLLPLERPFITAPASATILDLKMVLPQLHKGTAGHATFCIGSSSSLKDPSRFAMQTAAGNAAKAAQPQSLLLVIDPSVKLIELSAARLDGFAPLTLTFRLQS